MKSLVLSVLVAASAHADSAALNVQCRTKADNETQANVTGELSREGIDLKGELLVDIREDQKPLLNQKLIFAGLTLVDNSDYGIRVSLESGAGVSLFGTLPSGKREETTILLRYPAVEGSEKELAVLDCKRVD